MGVHFVTGQKKNASYKVFKRRPVNKKQDIPPDRETLVESTCHEFKLLRADYHDSATQVSGVFDQPFPPICQDRCG